MGMGDQGASSDCSDLSCLSSGPAAKQALVAPKAIAASPDGTLFVADFNLIKRISPDGIATTLLRIK